MDVANCFSRGVAEQGTLCLRRLLPRHRSWAPTLLFRVRRRLPTIKRGFRSPLPSPVAATPKAPNKDPYQDAMKTED
eukprot:2766636-Pyramimonas_sp.AAC.1